MKILLTGATGYIAQRLLPALLEEGHEVICCVRDLKRYNVPKYETGNVKVIEVNFLRQETLRNISADVDVAYYLIHSMSTQSGDFAEMEAECARNFRSSMENIGLKHVIYLSGIVNEQHLSRHLKSRQNVETILSEGDFALTTLRAGIIIGSGSASFEIIRDLVEKLPVMITPRWVNTKCQPIAIRNVIQFLQRVKLYAPAFNKSFDIGGTDILTYKEMMLRFARSRGLKRTIITLPVMTPRLSSYWLFFVTSTSYSLAKNLVNSMKVEVICKPNDLAEHLEIPLIDYDTSLKMAFDKIEQNLVLSSWKDAQTSGILDKGITSYIEVPVNGCFKDVRKREIHDRQKVLQKIWSLGGKTGWYYGNSLWRIRGLMDQLIGGVGMRRGRRSVSEIKPGDALDFWRVLLASQEEQRLLLYAEMKLPGEAWLEFKIEDHMLIQTATFRPRGISGRLYWYAVYPFHGFIFNGLIRRLTE